jgi:hypothetical protein
MKTYSLNYPKTGMVLAVAMLIAASITSCKKSNSVSPLATKLHNSTRLATNSIPSTISNGLIAYWTCANTAYDLSGNGHNGTLDSVTNTTDRLGHSNGAYLFSGTNSYITVPTSAALCLNDTSFTLNAWVKMNSYNSSYGSVVLGKRTSGAGNGWSWGITGSLATTAGVVSYNPGNTPDAFGLTVIGTTSWHMITSTYSYGNDKTLSIYIDGVLDHSTTGVPEVTAVTTTNLYIGRDDKSEPDNGYFLNGSLNDIRIYSRAITTTEISQLYNALN